MLLAATIHSNQITTQIDNGNIKSTRDVDFFFETSRGGERYDNNDNADASTQRRSNDRFGLLDSQERKSNDIGDTSQGGGDSQSPSQKSTIKFQKSLNEQLKDEATAEVGKEIEQAHDKRDEKINNAIGSSFVYGEV